MEPDVSIETSSMIRIAVLPIGTIHPHLFRNYVAMLGRHHKMELSAISSFYTQRQKSPFSQQPWNSGNLRFKYVIGGSPPSPWEDFQSYRKIHGVIGICHCPSCPDLDSVVRQFVAACKGYSSSLVQRCFAFSPGDSQLEDESKKRNKLVLFPPADQRTQEFHLQTMMQDIAASLLMEFEKWVLEAESGGTLLKTPLDSQASLSAEEAIKAKKRRHARAQKTIGDYCLLAGSPIDANAHYSTALELARMTGDYFWYAGALEGGVCAFLMSKAGDKDPTLVDEVKYRYNGVIMHYRKSFIQENAQRKMDMVVWCCLSKWSWMWEHGVAKIFYSGLCRLNFGLNSICSEFVEVVFQCAMSHSVTGNSRLTAFGSLFSSLGPEERTSRC